MEESLAVEMQPGHQRLVWTRPWTKAEGCACSCLCSSLGALQDRDVCLLARDTMEGLSSCQDSLRDPAIDGASQMGLLRALLLAAAFSSTSDCSRAFPASSFSSCIKDKPRQDHLCQLLCSRRAGQAEACFRGSSAPGLCRSRGCIKHFSLQGHQPGSLPWH